MPIKQTLHAVRGFFYLIRGLKLIFSSWSLFKYAIAPIIVNTTLFIIFFLSFNTIAYRISSSVFEQSSQEWYWVAISTVAGVALFTVSILAVLFGFVAVGLIIASPFNDLLSAAVERKLTGQLEEAGLPFFQWAGTLVKSESKKIAIFLLCQAGLLILNFIPVVGQVLFVILNPLFIAFVMAYEFAGYILDRRGMDFNAKRDYIFAAPGLTMGFGAAAGATLLIPLVHFLLMPAAVAGGTALVVENSVIESENGSESVIIKE
jgi:CysZ protein